jgi:hypothetical protein
MSDVEIDAGYARLLRLGVSSSPWDYPVTDADEAGWESEVARPWWAGIKERARRDGLRVNCFRGGDSLLQSIGKDPKIAAASLLSPNGKEYDATWIWSEASLARLAADWGETLAVARARHPFVTVGAP